MVNNDDIFENIILKRYLCSIYYSLGRTVEITFKNDIKAIGFFNGMNY